jgi:hypothetical protein
MNIDLRWKIPQPNQLWLSWKEAHLEGDGRVLLKKAFFHGPVLKDYLALEEAGHIYLDFTKHFIVLIPRPYVVKVEWKGILNQGPGGVYFKKVIIEDTTLGHLNKVKNSDSILLDCSGHTVENESAGNHIAAYAAMLYNELSEPYSFNN